MEKASLNEILFRLIAGIIEVIGRQMYDYIEGNLSTPMASQTLSAPAHNMFAEKTLGLLIHTHELNIAKEQDKRLLERDQKKDSSYQRKLQKKIQSVAEGKAELCIEFPEMDESHISITKAIIANPVVIDGLYFEHLWFINEENVLYEGKIVAVKLFKNCKVYKVTATY